MPLDAPQHRYFPYFIDDVYRCSGGCGSVSPDTLQCVVKTQNNVTGEVLELATNSLKRITVVNDTSCECACVTKAGDCSENEEFVESRCSCDCKYPDQPPTPCPERFRSVCNPYIKSSSIWTEACGVSLGSSSYVSKTKNRKVWEFS